MEVTGASLGTAVGIAADVIRSYGLKRQKDKAPVWNVPVAFDTETTNYNDRGDPVGWL